MWLGEQITAKGHRQRHLADHLFGHRGGHSGRHRTFVPAHPHRGHEHPVRHCSVGDDAGCSGGHCVRGAFPEAYSHSLRQASGGPQNVWRTDHAPAVAFEYRRGLPPFFAQSLLLFPATVAGFSQAAWIQRVVSWFQPTSILYNIVFIALIFFFCFFYTSIIFDPKDIAENLKKQGGFVPGIRPGENTRKYINDVLERLTLWGGVYISIISVLPMLLIAQFNVPFYFGGHQSAHPGGRGHRLHGAGGIAAHLASVRGPDGENPHPGQGLSMKKFRGVFIKNEREIALLRKANGMTAAILDEPGRQRAPRRADHAVRGYRAGHVSRLRGAAQLPGVRRLSLRLVLFGE